MAGFRSRTDRPRNLPLPTDADERTRLLDRAGASSSAPRRPPEEMAAFSADLSAERTRFTGDSASRRTASRPSPARSNPAATTFRVLPADPDAAKKPRIAVIRAATRSAKTSGSSSPRRPVAGARERSQHPVLLPGPDQAPARRAARNQASRRLQHVGRRMGTRVNVLWVLQRRNVATTTSLTLPR